MKRTRDAQARFDAALVDNMLAAKVADCVSVRRTVHDSVLNRNDGYARILMELELLWALIKKHPSTGFSNAERAKMASQAIEVAAAAVQFVTDCCRETEK